MLWKPNTVIAIIRDLCANQLRKLRPSEHIGSSQLVGNFLHPQNFPHLDSLELFQLATEVAVFFELHETQLEAKLLYSPSAKSWVDIVINSRGLYDQTICFHTSGSSGQPKMIKHELVDLQDEAQYWAGQFQNNQRVCKQIAGNVPRHHIYGFIFTTLVPYYLDFNYQDLRHKLPVYIFMDLPESIFITLPDYLKSFTDLELKAAKQLTVITSTSPCAPDVAAKAMTAGVETLMHIYGSTETGGIGVRINDDTYYRLLPFIQKNECDQLCKPSLDQHLNLDVQDDLRFIDERRFIVVGRKDQMVQIGGYNVSLTAVKEKLCACPQVLDATVRTFDSVSGPRLKAFIVPDPFVVDDIKYRNSSTSDFWKVDVQHFIRNNIPTEERPVDLQFGNHLPKNEYGKLTDWPIAL